MALANQPVGINSPFVPYDPYEVSFQDIPQVQNYQSIPAGQVQAQGQDWSGRYQSDYDQSLAANAAATGQRQYMQQVARGQAGPSLAELQLQQGLETTQANQMGAALTGRGGAGTQIAAMRSGGQAAMATNQAAAQQRAAEQQAAQQQVSALIGQEQAGAAQAGTLTSTQAGLEQGWQNQALQANLANQSTNLAASQTNAANYLQTQQANQAAYMQGLGYQAQSYDVANQVNADVEQAKLEAAVAKREQEYEAAGTVLSTIGSMAGMAAGSDERSKEQIQKLDAENADLRAALAAAASGEGPKVDSMRSAQPSEFQYRPDAYDQGFQPAAKPGERMVGVMAQDVAKGGDKGLVVEDPYSGRLGVDTGKLASAAAAGSSAALNRQDELEARIGELERERLFKQRFLEQEQGAFDQRFNAYQNAQQWADQPPTPSYRPAPWLQQYEQSLGGR
jgi:hypothetical protein